MRGSWGKFSLVQLWSAEAYAQLETFVMIATMQCTEPACLNHPWESAVIVLKSLTMPSKVETHQQDRSWSWERVLIHHHRSKIHQQQLNKPNYHGEFRQSTSYHKVNRPLQAFLQHFLYG